MTFKKGTKSKRRKNPRPTKAQLEQLYVKEKIGYTTIGKMFHIGSLDIRDLLVKYGIEIQGTARKGRIPWNKNTKGLMPTPANKGKKMPEWVIKKMKQGNVGRPSNRKGVTLTETTKEKIREKRQHQKNVRESKHEKILKKLLDNEGIDYVSHKGILRAQPDIFIQPNHTIFVDGDYFHFNPKPHIIRNEHRPGYKADSIGPNGIIARDKRNSDRRVTTRLRKSGYTVTRIWESEIEKDPEKCVQKILKAIKA